MFKIQLHRRINESMDLFQQIGLWHSGDEATARETRIKLLYSIYNLVLLVSVIVGAFKCDDIDESIFLLVSAAMEVVVFVRLLYLIWKKHEILELLHRNCEHSIEDHGQFVIVKEKLDAFAKFAVILTCSTTALGCRCTSFGK